MGTRSITRFFEAGCDIPFMSIYRQMDGYPSGHGVDLAKLCNRTLVNGFTPIMMAATHANGMGCLAASVIAGLKTGIGGIYICAPDESARGVDYIYNVRPGPDSHPILECSRAVAPAKPLIKERADKFAAKAAKHD